MTHSEKHPTIRGLNIGESEDEQINFYYSLSCCRVLVA
jgi:hypothetical protein